MHRTLCIAQLQQAAGIDTNNVAFQPAAARIHLNKPPLQCIVSDPIVEKLGKVVALPLRQAILHCQKNLRQNGLTVQPGALVVKMHTRIRAYRMLNAGSLLSLYSHRMGRVANGRMSCKLN